MNFRRRKRATWSKRPVRAAGREELTHELRGQGNPAVFFARAKSEGGEWGWGPTSTNQ